MHKKITLRVTSRVSGFASFIHLFNFLMGGVIAIMGHTFPAKASLVISLALAFLGYRIHRLTKRRIGL
jgi:uncharacterized membrane protein (DUF4010 family)